MIANGSVQSENVNSDSVGIHHLRDVRHESLNAEVGVFERLWKVARKLSQAWLSGRLAILAALTILLSFCTQGVILARFGLSVQSDSYFAAVIVPQVFFDIFATALTSVLVPTFVGMSLKDCQRLTWTYLHIIGGLLVGLFALLYWTAPSWTNVMLLGLSFEAKVLTVTLARICLISMVFSGMSAVVASYCRSQGRFVYPEVCTMLGALAGLAALVLMSPTCGIVAAAIGVVMRSVVEMLLLVPLMGCYRLPEFSSQTLRSSIRRMWPLLLSSCYQKTDMLIDRMLASLAPPGGITVLAFTRQIFHAVARLMNKAIAAPMLQYLSTRMRQNDAVGYWRVWRRTTLATLTLSFLGLGLIVLLGHTVLTEVLGQKVSATNGAHRIWVMFLALSGVMLGEPLTHVTANAFYAFHNTKTPAQISAFTFTLGIIFRVIGFAVFGVVGIGIGLSGYYLCYAVCMMLALFWAFQTRSFANKVDSRLIQEMEEQATVRADQSMRVLCVIPGNEGQQKSMPFVRRQVNSLCEAGIDVRAFYLRSRTSPLVLIQELARFRRILHEFDPHLVHAQFGTVTGLFTALASWRPAVMSCRGSDINPAPGVNWLRNFLGRIMSQLASLRMQQVICVSRQLSERLWWRKKQSVVIPNGVDFNLFRPISQNSAREKLRWNQRNAVVLFNARDDPIGKREDLVVAAVEIARKQHADIELCVLRGGVQPQEMPFYYGAADCLMMTSDHEGSPNVVKEALACGLPIISVDVGDVSERIRGVFPSYLVERDPEALAQALIQVLEQRQRSNGRAMVQELEESNITRRIIEIYRASLNRAA